MADRFHTIAMGNITRVVQPDLSTEDFVDENGFYIRSAVDATIKYCPVGNKTDAEAITKTFLASDIFIDPEMCRKIFRTPTSPDSDIYIGYGV